MNRPIALAAMQAGFIVLMKAGNRALRRVGDIHPTPFPYDPAFYSRLRADQVPRFLGALTSPQKLPVVTLPVSRLIATQNRVDAEKVGNMRGGKRPGYPVVAQIDNGFYIIDGHHGAAASWLDGADEIDVYFKDLTPVSNVLKGGF